MESGDVRLSEGWLSRGENGSLGVKDLHHRPTMMRQDDGSANLFAEEAGVFSSSSWQVFGGVL